MAYRLDTGILLRLIDEPDPQHGIVCDAVDILVGRQVELFITIQNIAEFWNVATRPKANNGFELPSATVSQLFSDAIEPICAVIREPDKLHAEFKRLLTQYAVVGKQVHDARLVAMMLTWQIENVLTLNECNFHRFAPEGITVVSPAAVLAAKPKNQNLRAAQKRTIQTYTNLLTSGWPQDAAALFFGNS
jgi:predicted nucleic acid-binding protein